MADTSIQWTDKTWNPVRGCSIVSPGCHSCYAMKQAHRFSGPGKAYHELTKLTERSGPQWTGKVVCDGSKLNEPLRWREPKRVFVNSMSDLFHEGVPDEFIDKVFAVMGLCERHTFQVLTKRAERMRAYFAVDDVDLRQRWADAAGTFLDGDWIWNEGKRFRTAIEQFVGRGYGLDESDDPEEGGEMVDAEPTPVPLPNVWLGVSAEDQQRADERIPLLLQTPAALRFVSAEPLLGPIDLAQSDHKAIEQCVIDGSTVERCIDWVIVGGESGNGARPMDLAWTRSIVAQCKAAGVACFVKQLGSVPRTSEFASVVIGECGIPQSDRPATVGHRLLLSDRKGGDPSEWPSDLRVRQFPEAVIRG